MKKKTIGIIICIFLITAALLPTSGFAVNASKINKPLFITNQKDPVISPLPGHMKSDLPNLPVSYQIIQEIPSEIESIAYDDDIISLFQQLDEDLYLGYLENLTAFGPRVTGTEECDDAGDYIYNQFVSMGLDAEYYYWEHDTLWSNNIIGTLYGEDQSSDEIYIICGHYDSVSGSPGADDDGSGTVAALAAAYLMKNAEFDHTIRFIAFSGEEQGLLGSYYYAQEAAQNGDNIVAVLNLDMISYAETPDDTTKMRIFDKEEVSTWITDFIELIAQEYNDILDLEIFPSGYSSGSDHHYFLEFGYHAIFGHEYSFNPYWHTSDDIIENMDMSYAVRITKLMIASLAELAGFITLNAPYIPNPPDGPANGNIDEEYTYSTLTTDPQEDQIFYLFDWDDGTDSGWLGPYNSGEEAEASHTWSKRGSYSIKAKAKDTEGYESEWSDPLAVSMPRNRGLIKIVDAIITRFQNNHPILGRLLNLPIFNL